MTDNKRVLIIGIDGGTWKVLDPAIKAGCMPFLKQLRLSSASGILESTIPAITPAAWGSFQTGMNPGENAVYDFNFWDKNTEQTNYVSSNNLKNTIWEIASDAGLNVAALNVPMTYPPKKINGIMVSGLLTPDLNSDFTYPSQFKQQLLKAVPDYEILTLNKALSKSHQKDYRALVKTLVENIDCRKKTADYMISQQTLDLFMVHFQASDTIQHELWHFLDDQHPLFDKSKRDYIFENFYRKLDSHIESVHKKFTDQGGDVMTVAMSDHGFQANLKRFDLEKFLTQQGYIEFRTTATASKASLPVRLAKKIGAGKALKKIIGNKKTDQLEKKVNLKGQAPNFSKSKVAFRGSCREAFIFLLEDTTEKRNTTARQLKQKLTELTDTGKAVIEKVYDKSQVFHGKYAEVMPDLIVVPAEGYTCTGKESKLKDLFADVDCSGDLQVGTHHSDGIVLLNHKSITPQQNLNANITDIAPTILYYLSLPIRSDCDGKALEDIFTDKFRNDNKPKITDQQQNQNSQPDQTYSPEDQAAIEKRLKDLGYL